MKLACGCRRDAWGVWSFRCPDGISLKGIERRALGAYRLQEGLDVTQQEMGPSPAHQAALNVWRAARADLKAHVGEVP